MRRVILILILVVIACAYRCAPVKADLSIGSRPPAFIGSSDEWINTQPLTWKNLDGKVVLIDFWK